METFGMLCPMNNSLSYGESRYNNNFQAHLPIVPEE
jgi:hypothetical protein